MVKFGITEYKSNQRREGGSEPETSAWQIQRPITANPCHALNIIIICLCMNRIKQLTMTYLECKTTWPRLGRDENQMQNWRRSAWTRCTDQTWPRGAMTNILITIHPETQTLKDTWNKQFAFGSDHSNCHCFLLIWFKLYKILFQPHDV